MIIRKATKQDLPQILQLIKELAAFENEPHAVEISIDDLEKDGFSENSLYQCVVAEIDTQIYGMALYYYRFSTWKGKTIHLEDLIVSKDSRGKGIGYNLYKAVIAQAQKDNVKRVEWVVLNWNKPAINFYEKSGAKIFDDWRIVQMDEEGINAFLNQNAPI